MADYAIHDTTLEAIADTIRKKDGTSALIDPADYADRINLMGMLEEKTISGTIASCSDGADTVPLKSWTIDVNPNLSGKSQIVATQFQGVNFFNEDWEVGGINDTTGLPNSDTNKIRSKTFSRIKGGVTIYIKTPQPIRVLFYEADETFISETANIRNNTFTVPSNASLFKIRGTVDYGTTYNDDISINYPSTDTDYHAYVSAPVDNTVNLGRTIYGGQVDVVNGTGTDEYNKITLSSLLTDLNVAQIGTTGVYRIRFSLADAKGAVNSAVFNGLCDYYTPLTANQTYNKNDGISINTSGQCYIYDSRFNTSTSLNDFKTWIDANPVNLSYELATPTDFTFTPITPTPETELGVNNFWADEGDSEVVYRSSGTVYNYPTGEEVSF